MAIVRYRALQVAVCFTLVGRAACAQEGQDEMSWARAALARNDRIEVVGADQQTRTFTVRVKDTGELRVLRADQLIAGPALAANAPPAAAPAHGAAAPVATAPDNGPVARAGEAAVPPDASAPSAAPARAPADTAGGPGLEGRPGHSNKAAPPPPPAAQGGGVRASPAPPPPGGRRPDAIPCRGPRLLS